MSSNKTLGETIVKQFTFHFQYNENNLDIKIIPLINTAKIFSSRNISKEQHID